MGGRVVNLTLHGVGEHTHPLEAGEDQTWLTVDEFEIVLAGVLGHADIRLMFDDGNSSDIDIVLPRLMEHGLTASFFVLAGRFGEAGRVDRSDVRELQRAGMHIGSHGWAHRSWRELTPKQARQEMLDAPRVLAEVCKRQVSQVAVPYGHYDRRVLSRLRSAGTTTAYTSDGGPSRAGRWLQPRTSLRRGVDAAAMDSLARGAEGPAEFAARRAKRVLKRYR